MVKILKDLNNIFKYVQKFLVLNKNASSESSSKGALWGFGILLALGIFFLTAWVSAILRPIPLPFITSFVESSFNRQNPLFQLKIGSTFWHVKHWKDFFSLELRDVELFEHQGPDYIDPTFLESHPEIIDYQANQSLRPLMTVLSMQITIDKLSLIKGKLNFNSLKFIKPHFHLTIYPSEKLAFCHERPAIENLTKNSTESEMYCHSQFQNISALQVEELSHTLARSIGYIGLQNATISIHDWQNADSFKMHTLSNIDLYIDSRTPQPIGILTGQLEQEKIVPFYIGIEYKDQNHYYLDIQIKELIPSRIIALQPIFNAFVPNEYFNDVRNLFRHLSHFNVPIYIDVKGALHNLSMNVKLEQGNIWLPFLHPEILNVQKVCIESQLLPKTLKINKIEAEIDHIKAYVTGEIIFEEFLAKILWKGQSSIQQIPLDKVAYYWRKPGPTQQWITTHMAAGHFTEVTNDSEITGRWDKNVQSWTWQIHKTEGQLKCADTSVIYIKNMPPILNVNGYGTYTGEKVDITLDSGHWRHLKLKNGHVRLLDLHLDDQHAIIDLPLEGTIEDIMYLLGLPALDYAKSLKVNTESFKGNLKGQLHLKFPMKTTLSLKEIGLNAQAAIEKLSIDIPFQDKKLSLKSYKGELEIDESSMLLKGMGELEKIPCTLTWRHNFQDQVPFKRSFTLKSHFNSQFLYDHIPELIPLVSQDLLLEIDWNETHLGESAITLKGDLKNATVHLPWLSWMKESGKPAHFETLIGYKPNMPLTIERLNLMSDSLNIEANAIVEWHPDIHLTHLDIHKAEGLTQNFQLILQKKPEQFFHLEIKGQKFDIGGILDTLVKSENNVSKDHVRVDLNIEELILGQQRHLHQVKGFCNFKQGRLQQSHITGYVNSAGQIVLDVCPERIKNQDILNLLLTCSDAGEFFRVAGFSDNLAEGRLVLEAHRPHDDLSPFVGHITLNDFALKDASLVTRLLALASPAGIAQLFSGGGVVFNQCIADFMIKEHGIHLSRGRAVSPAIGVTFEGDIDRTRETIAMRGNVIPFNMINGAIGHIPIIGQLLGGDNGVFSAVYSVTGPIEEPIITVNPLSLLTPNFLKQLFGEMTPVQIVKEDDVPPLLKKNTDKKPLDNKRSIFKNEISDEQSSLNTARSKGEIISDPGISKIHSSLIDKNKNPMKIIKVPEDIPISSPELRVKSAPKEEVKINSSSSE